jgi:hypothetical protein
MILRESDLKGGESMTTAARGMSSVFLLSFDLEWLRDTAKRLNVSTADVLEASIRHIQKEEKETGQLFAPIDISKMRTKHLPADPKEVQRLQRAGIYATLEEQRKRALGLYMQMVGLDASEV